MGCCVQAETQQGLFIRAVGALKWAMGAVDGGDREKTTTIRLETPDRSIMLADWLNEILYLIEGERVYPAIHQLTLDAHSLTADITVSTVETISPQYTPEATTYHGVTISHKGNRYVREVIFDI